MTKIIEQIKYLKKQYSSKGLSDTEIIKQIADDLKLPILLVKIIYMLV